MDLDILKLADLLKSNQTKDSDSEDDLEDQNTDSEEIKPGDIGKKPAKSSGSVYTKPLVKEESKQPDLLDPDEAALYLTETPEVSSDWRKTPQWDVSYKQQVTASDVFLQMGAKNPSSASCEDMILSVHLPEEDHHNIDLKVTKDRIILVSSKYRLDVPLPHPVDPKLGNAKWDKDAEKLNITLRMDREFDFVNF